MYLVSSRSGWSAVRAAEGRDLDQLVELMRDTFQQQFASLLSPCEAERFAAENARPAPGERYFVIEADGKLVGYAAARERGPNRLVVERVYVLSGAAPRGAVNALIVAACGEDTGDAAVRVLEIFNRCGFVDMPAVRAFLARPQTVGLLPEVFASA